MSHHYYREEPNVRFSPDKSLVLFTSNMFGPSFSETGLNRKTEKLIHRKLIEKPLS